MASSALPETLKAVTATKIQELKHQRDSYERQRSQAERSASKAPDLLSETRVLLKGTYKIKNVRPQVDDSSDDEGYTPSAPAANALHNKHLLLQQAAVDPSVADDIVKGIKKELEDDLELQSARHEHAQFFSDLVTEWLSNPDNQKKDSELDPSVDGSSFEELGRKEMHEQRKIWEELVFKKATVDTAKMKDYLNGLFCSSKVAKNAHEQLVKQTRNFCSTLSENKNMFDSSTLQNTIRGLMSSDLFGEEKTGILRTFESNKEVLKEVCDVLNMRLASLGTWKWSTSGNGIPVEMRRQLNGKYRVFMDEEVLDGLMLFTLGLKFSVHFKSVFLRFLESYAWSSTDKQIPKEDREYWEYYFGKPSVRATVSSLRKQSYKNDYFMTQLPINEDVGKRNYDDDDDDGDQDKTVKNPMELKHGLLHLVVTEALLAKHLRPHERHTVIRSDFKWFGPALPHDTIYTVLKFFGVDDDWLDFFKRFLEVPLKFVHDGPDAQPQTRQRGVPMSHTFTDVFGETVLFIMDFAVNQATSSNFYRLHDDFWFWGSEKTCIKAWKAMTTFAATMGIEFNEEKTGVVYFKVDADDISTDTDGSVSEDSFEDKNAYREGSTQLPTGEVRWGLLQLDASTARFVVDQSLVDEHVKELRLQLSYCNSIFSWIQCYNAYLARFFSNNFGKPSYGFGRSHIDQMIHTLVRVQKALFPNGSVTAHLVSLSQERFNITELPDGFWYWPVSLGGVELRNPLIPLFAMRENIRISPERRLEKSLDEEEIEYVAAQTRFSNEETSASKWTSSVSARIAHSGEKFMPKGEYLKYREQRSAILAGVYRRLLQVPSEHELSITPEIESWFENARPVPGRATICDPPSSMQPYWKWILGLYGKQVVEKYGGIEIVDAEQVPIGIVNLMKAGKVRWHG